MISELDKRIICALSNDLPLAREPFAGIAENLGISQTELFHRIAALKEAGMLRRIGAAVKHGDAGYPANVMVVWDIKNEEIGAAGAYMQEQPEISHCYLRRKHDGWPYNLYTMLHGRTRQDCEASIGRIAENVEHRGFLRLYTLKELKKTGAKYFIHL